MLQKKTNYSCWFPEKSKKHLKKKKWSLVTEVDKPKTSSKYSETKKVKQVHSVIPN